MKLPIIIFAVAAVSGTLVSSGLCGTPPGGKDIGGMDAYYSWLQSCFSGLRKDMPRITASAEAAAKLFVESNYSVGSWGDPAFVHEFSGRAGGLMPVGNPDFDGNGVERNIVLMASRPDHLEEDLARAAKLKRDDNYLVLFARPQVAAMASKLGAKFDAVVNTHAAENGGLFRTVNGGWNVQTDTLANLTAMWTWTGEFVAACTRLGKMPPMWLSFSAPEGSARQKLYQHKKFHDAAPAAVAPGRAGLDYLAKVEANINAIYAADRDNLKLIAARAAQANANGKRAYVALLGHATEQRLPESFNPKRFIQLVDRHARYKFQPGDFLLCVGYDGKYQEKEFGDLSRAARAAGSDVAWIVSTYGNRDLDCVQNGDTLIDQRWELGDGAVQLPGYDIKVLPPSAIVGLGLFWMIGAETVSLEGGPVAIR